MLLCIYTLQAATEQFTTALYTIEPSAWKLYLVAFIVSGDVDHISVIAQKLHFARTSRI